MTVLALAVVLIAVVVIIIAVCRQREKGLNADLATLRAEKKTLEDSIPVQRKAAVRKSRSVNTGLITQDIAPLLPTWPYSLKDTRPVGAPLDFIVFDGMDNDAVEKIVFVEVKSGKSRMTARQRQIMKAVEEGRVEYKVYTPQSASENSIIGGNEKE